jgi:hypothetical protein
VLARRSCTHPMTDGQLCRAGPQRERPLCFAHDPERATEAAEARRRGGLRRRKEGTIAVAYDLPGLDSLPGIRRLLEIVQTDGLSLETGVAKLRILIAVAGAATNLLKVGELEDRLSVLETAVRQRSAEDEPVALG